MVNKKPNKVGKNYSKLKIPSTGNKAYKKLIKNMSMFSLESPNQTAVVGKNFTCKNSSKKLESGKKKRKGNIR